MPHCKDFTFCCNTVLLFSQCFLLLPFDSKAVYWSSIMYKMWQSGLTFVSVLHGTWRHLIQPKFLFEVKLLLWPFFFFLLAIKQNFKLYFLWFFFTILLIFFKKNCFLFLDQYPELTFSLKFSFTDDNYVTFKKNLCVNQQVFWRISGQ